MGIQQEITTIKKMYDNLKPEDVAAQMRKEMKLSLKAVKTIQLLSPEDQQIINNWMAANTDDATATVRRLALAAQNLDNPEEQQKLATTLLNIAKASSLE